MHPNNWRNNRPNFNNFGGWNSNSDEGFPDPDYFDERDEEFMGNRFGWQNNGRGCGPPPGPFPMGGFNGGPDGWGPPPNFDCGPPNMFAWGRGFGPSGPPVQHPKKHNKPFAFLLRCGVSKERIKNLPRQYLRLITPEECGVCNLMFESFETSRQHYASNNHFKRQNKWMAEYRRTHHPKTELPMKSRDLYCELCDVQITSKVHAQSHYDGKSHRAIVEGRKRPKNNYLLRKKLTARIEQLIRREKKFIKPIQEEDKKEEEVPAKITAPELYCNICKTSVTCAEQMTMHLNGKKHLTKEKQHILNMMKGDEENEDEKDGDAEEVAEQETDMEKAEDDDDVAETENQEDTDDKYDWGNGSGAWEEDVNQEEK